MFRFSVRGPGGIKAVGARLLGFKQGWAGSGHAILGIWVSD